MRTLIVDGYNLIYAIPELEELLDESLEAAREGLIRFLAEFKGGRRDIERLYVVFDGKDGFMSDEISVGQGITAIFSRSARTADEKIIDIVKDAQNPESITVVSNDNFLYNNVRVHGGRIKTVDEFLRMVK
ncbi:MAG: NYN domain-containing protein [Candidatus Omnitrophota bacterium]